MEFRGEEAQQTKHNKNSANHQPLPIAIHVACLNWIMLSRVN